MERMGWRAALAFTAAGAMLAAQPAQGAMGCWNQEPAAAAKVRDLQSRLMVAALRCRAMGVDVLAAYNDFVRRNRSALQTQNNLIHAQFDTGYGAEGETYYDRFTTSLANRYGGDATNEQICNDTAWAAQEGAAAAGDVSKLIALADRFGSSPDLPGGECPAGLAPRSAAQPAAKWQRAAPATFAAIMDRALSDVSDAPAEGAENPHIKISLYLHLAVAATTSAARDRRQGAWSSWVEPQPAVQRRTWIRLRKKSLRSCFVFEENFRGDPGPDPFRRLCDPRHRARRFRPQGDRDRRD